MSLHRSAGCVVMLTVVLVPGAIGLHHALPVLTDRQPPAVDLGALVLDDRFHAAAWDDGEVADERVVATVRVSGCGHDRTVRPGVPRVSLGDVVAGEVLAERLVPGPCTLRVEAWDGPFGPVTSEVRELVVYPGGAVLDASGVRADGTPPTVDLSTDGAVVRDALSGVASVEVRTRCGAGGWAVVKRHTWAELARRVRVSPLLPDLDTALPWFGQPSTCEGRVVAADHAGHVAEAVVRWFRFADVAVPEATVLADLLPPVLEGAGPGPLDGFALADATGIRRVEAALTCASGSAPLPSQEYVARTPRVPVASLVPARLPPGECSLSLTATDHAGRAATHEIALRVGADGTVVAQPPRGDRAPPGIRGPLRTPADLERARWFDDAPGIVAVYGRVSCAHEVPVDLVPTSVDPPARFARVLPEPLPLVRGRCEVTLAALDAEGLSATASLSLFAYRDGTVVPVDRVDEAAEPEVVGWAAAAADGRVTAAEWSTVALADAGAGLAEVRVGLDCPRVAVPPRVATWEGPTGLVRMADVLPEPAAAADGRRCGVEVFAVDHVGNALVQTLGRVRFR